MIDDVLQVLQDGGASKTTTTGIYISIALILTAIVLFAVLFAQYKKVQASRLEEYDALLLRKSALDLHRCIDANDNVTVARLHTDDSSVVKPEEKVLIAKDTEQTQNEPSTTGEKIFEAIESGQLIKTLSGFSVVGKKLNKKIEERTGVKPMTPEQELEAQRIARLTDQTVNPLFVFRRRLYEEGSSDDENDENEESDAESD